MTVGELAQHNHSGSAASTTLKGTVEQVYLWDSKVSGIISKTYIGGAPEGAASGTVERLTINATHTHNLSLNNTGNNTAHNNQQPYIVAFIWRRTA